MKDEIIDAALRVHEEAQKEGTTGIGAVVRWLLHHSQLSGEHGDGIIIGASNLEQLQQKLENCEAGPLSDNLLQLVEDIWKVAEPHADAHNIL